MRKANQRKLLKENPHCIFCAGKRSATTVEHMPNKGMFPAKMRPPGLEFPSCEQCNRGSRWAEDIAAYIGSIQLNSTPAGIRHFEAKLTHLIRNNPDAISAMTPTARQCRLSSRLCDEHGEPAGVMDLRAPLIDTAMLIYGAKLALGLHWQETGEVLSSAGSVTVIWFSNANAIAREVPQQFFELIPDAKTLRQGKLTARNVFEYGSRKTSDSDSSAHWATFGQSFMYYLAVGEGKAPSAIPSSQVFHPDCFADSKPTISEWMPEPGWSA